MWLFGACDIFSLSLIYIPSFSTMPLPHSHTPYLYLCIHFILFPHLSLIFLYLYLFLTRACGDITTPATYTVMWHHMSRRVAHHHCMLAKGSSSYSLWISLCYRDSCRCTTKIISTHVHIISDLYTLDFPLLSCRSRALVILSCAFLRLPLHWQAGWSQKFESTRWCTI